jgi:hypothetical protein
VQIQFDSEETTDMQFKRYATALVLMCAFAAPVLAQWDGEPKGAPTALSPDAATLATFTASETNAYVVIQCTGAFFWLPGATVSSSTGIMVPSRPDGTARVKLQGANKKVSVISNSGSISCYAWELKKER